MTRDGRRALSPDEPRWLRQVRELRVGYAMQQLAESERSPSDVALAAGFYDHSHLNRAVKRATGLTPAQVRASVQRG